MSARYLMGLDVGGGEGRCLIVNTVIGETCSAFRAWSLAPDPAAGGLTVFGTGKYMALGRPHHWARQDPLSEEKVEGFKRSLEGMNLKVDVGR